MIKVFEVTARGEKERIYAIKTLMELSRLNPHNAVDRSLSLHEAKCAHDRMREGETFLLDIKPFVWENLTLINEARTFYTINDLERPQSFTEGLKDEIISAIRDNNIEKAKDLFSIFTTYYN